MSKRWKFTDSQKAELERLGKTHPKAYVRVRALALYHMACGRTAMDAASTVLAHRVTVSDWACRYLEFGVAGLIIAEGRGRPCQASAEELERYLRQSPRSFGVLRSRWTLRALAEVVPCLQGMSDAGVLQALRRCGYGFKRGQPHHHSPDPDYEAKKGRWTKF